MLVPGHDDLCSPARRYVQKSDIVVEIFGGVSFL